MSTNERTPASITGEFDENLDDYGSAHGFEEAHGDFRRTATGEIRTIRGPAMVAAQLVRVLRTPIGDDPFRPDLGLDKQQLLGNTDAEAKQAIINAIGPEADPRVAQLAPGDITIEYPDGTRDVSMTVDATLTDGTPLEFSAQFRSIVGVDR